MIHGLWALRHRWRDALIPYLFGASIVAGCLVFYGSPRMRAMLEPLLVVLAAGALLWLCDRLRARALPALAAHDSRSSVDTVRV